MLVEPRGADNERRRGLRSPRLPVGPLRQAGTGFTVAVYPLGPSACILRIPASRSWQALVPAQATADNREAHTAS